VVIVTKDEDFAIWRIASNAKAPPVVWLRMGNTRRSELLERMEFLLPQVLAGLESGEAQDGVVNPSRAPNDPSHALGGDRDRHPRPRSRVDTIPGQRAMRQPGGIA
jgi:hypothetical protein